MKKNQKDMKLSSWYNFKPPRKSTEFSKKTHIKTIEWSDLNELERK